MMSDRPEDLPEWAWKRTEGYHVALYGKDARFVRSFVARSILKAREEAFEEAATLADGFAADAQTTNRSPHRVVEDVASAIRQHSQKGER